MNKKVLFIKERNKYYSYHDIYSYKNKDILATLNDSMSYGKNNIYCMCNGKNSDKGVKMHTRMLSTGHYILVDSKNNKIKHKHDCPKVNEDSVKYFMANKGRVITKADLHLNLLKPINKRNYLNTGLFNIYSDLFYLGEAILAMANNGYIDKRSNIGTQNQVLSYLYGYYDKGINSGINSELNNLKIADGIELKDIIFNPKWIKCDEAIDKTSNVIRNSVEINKRHGSENYIVNQYVLAKYDGYTPEKDGTVNIELYIKCKKLEGDNEKKVYLNMDRFKFFKVLNQYKIDENGAAEYFVSALVHEKDKRILVDDIAFIPVYPKYCIPVDNLEQIKILDEFIKIRNRVNVKRIAKIDDTFAKELGKNIPDFIVEIKGSSRVVLVESFDYIFTEYYKETLLKTKGYSELIKGGKYEFLGIYNNIGWRTPPVSIVLEGNYKTMDGLYPKVKFNIDKILKGDRS